MIVLPSFYLAICAPVVGICLAAVFGQIWCRKYLLLYCQ